MTNFPAVYIANGTAILLLFVILLSTKKPVRHGLFDEKLFYLMVLLNVLQCLIDTAAFIVDGKAGYHTLSKVLNVFLFVSGAIFAYSWVIYADYKLFTDMERIKRIYPFVGIPAMLIIIGYLINLATPVFFVIDEYNIYRRTSLFPVAYAVIYFYLAYGVVLICSYRKKVHKYLFLPVVLFVIPVIIGSLLQFFFYGYSLMWLGLSIGMIALFVNVQNEASYVDTLSGVFNRQYLNNILFMLSKKKATATVPAGIMLDIDNFKSINNRFGHTVGDDAISTVGKMLRTAVDDQGIVCRYGGDEFVILIYINSQKELRDMVDMIKKQEALFNQSEKKPYKINFSIGCGTYENMYESIDDFLKKMDTSMFEDKKRKISEGIMSDRRRTC